MTNPGKRIGLSDGRTRTLMTRLLRRHVRPQSGRILLALACMATAAAATAALAYQMEPVIDRVFAEADREALLTVALTVLAIFVVKGVATYGQAAMMTYVGQRIVANLQAAMFEHLMRADLGFFHDHAPGQLISRFTHDTNLLRNVVSTTLTSLGKDSLTLLFLVGLMFYQDWLLAGIAFFAFPTAVLPIARIGRRMRKVSASSQTKTGELSGLLDEVFQGARQVKAYGMEGYETRRAAAAIERLFHLLAKAGRIRAIAHPVMETLGGFAIVAVILYGGHQVIDGAKTPGAFFSFITALLLAYEPMKRLANLNAHLQEGLAAADRVFALLDTRPRITDRPDAAPLRIDGGAIAFEGVSFGYGGKDHHGGENDGLALTNLDLDIPAGWTVALVGPSGAGKSTVLNLIPRFFDADAGRVLVDGQDVRDVALASLRAAIALVSQESLLFDDTVRANILYGRPEASEAEVIAAAKAADAHGFIGELPEGYDTQVGPRGVRLSGGQRQRVAIARAMLRDAPILLLDEATSALDTESERQVQRALGRLKRGRTTVVIAHRLSTVVSADRIYVMDKGTVVEWGSHAELIARDGAYARLYSLQFAPETAEAAEPEERDGTARARA